MKHSILIILGCINSYLSYAQCFHGEYTTEWQWDMKKETNWVNLLKLNLSVPVWNRMGSFEATTIHVAKTNECIIDDWQTFSNIEEENELAAIAVLGYMHEWKECHLFVGIRNLNEDFFTSDVTSLFTNSSCGIVTIQRSNTIDNQLFCAMVSTNDWSKISKNRYVYFLFVCIFYLILSI